MRKTESREKATAGPLTFSLSPATCHTGRDANHGFSPASKRAGVPDGRAWPAVSCDRSQITRTRVTDTGGIAAFPSGMAGMRRGLGSNLYRLGVPDMVIQRILRHANVSATATYYIKTAAADVRSAMTKLENHIAEAGQAQGETNGTLEPSSGSRPSNADYSLGYFD